VVNRNRRAWLSECQSNPNETTQKKPDLTISRILAWADEYHRTEGRWPIRKSGRIPLTDENWGAIHAALVKGSRGLSPGRGLPELLRIHRGVRNRLNAPPLTEERIVRLATAHFRRTGRWPTYESGPIEEVPGETWNAISNALRHGLRGLRGGTTLSDFLQSHDLQRNRLRLPTFTVKQVLAWAEAYYQRHGRWPSKSSGQIEQAPLETWEAVNGALRRGARGLPGGLSLPRFLYFHRGVPLKVAFHKVPRSPCCSRSMD
jgi:hypothetical protein